MKNSPSPREATYRSPLEERYASQLMLQLFSADWKYKTWRRLWFYLAKAQQKLGLPISDDALTQLQASLTAPIDWERVHCYEKRFRHDVMAHVYALGEAAPAAKGIIHLGATSAYVGDNTAIIAMREGLILIKCKLLEVIENLTEKAKQYKHIPTLSYTHFQPAQPTTVGKRLTLYLQEFLLDLEELDFIIEHLPLRGVKGASGTQASFLTLFNGDHEKVKKLDADIASQCGFKKQLMITGQTSSRKLDYRVAAWLSAVAQSASKFATDMRLLQHKKEWAEPFDSEQIGSSAMAFKRNPMRSERIGSLARFVIALPFSFAYTASTQWLERTLDDSANHRLSMAEAFLAVDGIFELLRNITAQFEIFPEMIALNLQREWPFMVLETLMMRAVKEKGSNRQDIHHATQRLSQLINQKIIHNELKNPENPLEDFRNDLMQTYDLTPAEWNEYTLHKNFIGRSDHQVSEFIEEILTPAITAAKAKLSAYKKNLALAKAEVRV